jgi:hypothetical protein
MMGESPVRPVAIRIQNLAMEATIERVENLMKLLKLSV